MSFRVGARVRYIRDDSNVPKGSVGTVSPSDRGGSTGVEVIFDDVDKPPYHDGWVVPLGSIESVPFSVGDYVEYVGDRAVSSYEYPNKGDRGYVLPARDNESPTSVVVKWDNGLSAGMPDGGFSCDESRLILIEAAEQDFSESAGGEIDSVLDIAKKICYGDRNIDYGDPYDDYVKTAGFFSIILGTEVKPHQAAMMMICVKLSRLMHDPTKRDSIVDVAGYADVLDRIVKREFA